MEKPCVLILAAGQGTRMKSRKAKVLHQAGGAALIQHVVRAAQGVSPQVAVIVGHQADQVKALLPGLTTILQQQQLGTGHAVLCAREELGNLKGNLMVLPGDVPLVRAETLQHFLAFHTEGSFRASILTAEVGDPSGYGRIVRSGDGHVSRIVEHRDASEEIRAIREINSGIYVFDAPALFEALAQVRNQNNQSEYYLTDVIGILTGRREKVGAFKIANPEEILGVNTRQELSGMDRAMRRRKCEELMTQGVTIFDPASTFIDMDVQIGADSVLYPFVQLQGRTQIAEDVTIRSYTRITDCRIGARSTVLEGCVMEESELCEDVTIGPYTRLRPGVKLDDMVKVGNFVEMKKSTLGKGSKAMHLAYVGDAIVGKNVNIGAGVITVNYDGTKKYPTHIEDDAFIGSDSTLIAPVRIEKGAFVAAGSAITDDVPSEALAIARGRQVVKEGRAPHRKKRE
jgi:bifunctional UDP-N-acetylglucosamine pyrophosphorylase/glucosamine-1-phosphate N-acetyltransferase